MPEILAVSRRRSAADGAVGRAAPVRPAPLRTLLLTGALLAAGGAPALGQGPAVGGPAAGGTRAAHGMVVSAYPLASRVGVDVLRAGGNAVDAAVATGFALAVTHPSAGNIGGGGFMVIRLPDGRATTIDFREKAPLAARPTMFTDSAGEYSYRLHHGSALSVGVPGTVAGFALASGRYGRSKWAALVRPAVKLARDGFPLTSSLARSLEYGVRAMKDHPASVRTFSRDGAPYGAGERFRQPALAATLERIEHGGRDGFYRGETARLVTAEMRRDGGLITEEDLARYQAVERAPIRGTYRGYDIISMPPPSSGGIAIVEMLNILEGYDLKSLGANSAGYLHLLTEAMRRAFRDRAALVGDVDFATVPIERLTSKAYAAELRKTIDAEHATRSQPADVAADHESLETTHYSVVDAEGMAVSVTYTLEQGYGSKITVDGAGFLLNNEMGDFNGKPGLTTADGLIGTDPNLARPEQRMLSSMSPSIIARDGRLVAVVGSPGGRTIINTVLEVMLNLIDFGMPIQQAVDAGRMHHQWLPDVIHLEDGAVPAATVAELRRMGHAVEVGGRQGVADCIAIDPATGARIGAADPRDPDSSVAGY